MKPLLAFHNDPAIKEKYIARVRAHRKADEIIHGAYWENGKGCAIGCTVHSSSHAAYETELGIPRILARLEDSIFEGLTNCAALEWPEQFLDAIESGANLAGVSDKFIHWLLIDPKDGVIRFASTEQTRKAIQVVGDLYARRINGESISHSAWHAAATDAAATATAWHAATGAADADAAAATATAAAWHAADAAVTATAWHAATAAADADATAATAWHAGKNKSRLRQSEKLIELLEACKP